MKQPQLTFRELSHFLAVISQGGFVKASQALAVSQPSISQSIQSIERKIGATLIVRNKKSVVLTEKGQVFRRYAERTLREELNLREALGSGFDMVEGRLRVSVPPAISSLCFPEIIERFCNRYPDVILEVDECPSDRLIPRLRSGHTEIAALVLPLNERDIQTRLLCKDTLCLVMPDSHPFSSRSEIQVRDILQERLVLLREDFKINRFVNLAFSAHGVTPQIAGRSSDITLLMAMVRAGVGIALIPSLLCRGTWAENLVVSSQLLPGMSFELGLATRHDHELSRAGQAWQDMCLEHFSRSPEEGFLLQDKTSDEQAI